MLRRTCLSLSNSFVFWLHLTIFTALALGALTVPAAENGPDPAKVGPGTAKMVALLERLNRENDANASRNPFANEARAKSLRVQLSSTPDERDRLSLQAQLGMELLNYGEPQEALAEFQHAL